MSGRLAEVLAVSAVAAAITILMAWAVIRAPSERMFGMDIVGRHHDPFTVMQQFERPISIGMYSQPVTDITGALFSRVAGPIAAYNWLILLSFPLAAAITYLLARHLALSPFAATVAALAYAFSPFHLAHAAYHPHIAQVQWLPLYLLALWRCLDAATPVAIGFLGVATLAVTLSNFYGGVIAAVITPIAVGAYWLVMRPVTRRPTHAVSVTVLTLAFIAVCGLAYVTYLAQSMLAHRDAFAFQRSDVLLFSAQWWSYLVPPVAHPLLGATAHRIWIEAGVRDGLLEQQVSLGWGIVALALIAVGRYIWIVRNRESACGVRVPILVAVAIAAFACSLSSLPSALLYDVVPMFRAYARFGVLVQLMGALLAGVGVDFLLRAGTTRARMACAVLIALVAFEYAAAPQALSRDVLPTTAHRWVVQQPGRARTFDCAPRDDASASIQWLTADRVMVPASSTDCTEPNLSRKLAASGYTQLLVRRDTADGQWFVNHTAPSGLRVAANFEDGVVFAVTAPPPDIYTAATTGFFPREHDAEWSWQWMGARAGWTIVNTTDRPVVAVISLEVAAFHRARHMELALDGRPAQTVVIDPLRRVYQIGPLTVPSGSHYLAFRPAEAPTVADDVMKNGDGRPLSFAVGAWSWSTAEP